MPFSETSPCVTTLRDEPIVKPGCVPLTWKSIGRDCCRNVGAEPMYESSMLWRSASNAWAAVTVDVSCAPAPIASIHNRLGNAALNQLDLAVHWRLDTALRCWIGDNRADQFGPDFCRCFLCNLRAHLQEVLRRFGHEHVAVRQLALNVADWGRGGRCMSAVAMVVTGPRRCMRWKRRTEQDGEQNHFGDMPEVVSRTQQFGLLSIRRPRRAVGRNAHGPEGKR